MQNLKSRINRKINCSIDKTFIQLLLAVFLMVKRRTIASMSTLCTSVIFMSKNNCVWQLYLTVTRDNDKEPQETFTYSLLWSFQQKIKGIRLRTTKAPLCQPLFMLRDDVRTCPGPLTRCNSCDKQTSAGTCVFIISVSFPK